MNPFQFEHTYRLSEAEYTAVHSALLGLRPWRRTFRRLGIALLGIACLFWAYTLLLGVTILALTALFLTIPHFLPGTTARVYREVAYLHDAITYGVSDEAVWLQGSDFSIRAGWRHVTVWLETGPWLVLRLQTMPSIYLPVADLRARGVYDSVMELARTHATQFNNPRSKRIRRASLVALLVCLAPFISHDAPVQTAYEPLRVQVAPEPSVYSAMLELRYHAVPGSKLLIREEPVPMRAISGSQTDWLRQFDDVPEVLRRAASQDSPAKTLKLDPAWFPAAARFISERAIQEVFAGGGAANWSVFQQKYRSQGWLAFSDVLVTKDGLDAFLYYEAACGGLCGEGGYAWLKRDPNTSRWSLVKRIISFMA
jgi:hypothetical protein